MVITLKISNMRKMMLRFFFVVERVDVRRWIWSLSLEIVFANLFLTATVAINFVAVARFFTTTAVVFATVAIRLVTVGKTSMFLPTIENQRPVKSEAKQPRNGIQKLK